MSHLSDAFDNIPSPAYHGGVASVIEVCRSVRSLLNKLYDRKHITDRDRKLIAQSENALYSCIETMESIDCDSSLRQVARYMAGDLVLVWSLQSFHDGGFLCGAPGFVTQGNDDNEDSIMVAVCRKIRGEMKLDDAYEVYPQQVKRCDLSRWGANEMLNNLYNQKPWLRK